MGPIKVIFSCFIILFWESISVALPDLQFTKTLSYVIVTFYPSTQSSFVLNKLF